MDHYMDIRLRPDPEFAAHQLLGALYSKLHRALVQIDSNDIGVSFPDVSQDGKRLGQRLRLHGTAAALRGLSSRGWLEGMRDHVDVNETKPAPQTALHRSIRRIQVQSNAARLRRRLMLRKGVSEMEALKQIPDAASRKTDLPFITLRSQSTRQAFPLFILHDAPTKEQIAGPFNAYGLSQIATIPWF
jgi:CRISPR-associated endonuclease Csy4